MEILHVQDTSDEVRVELSGAFTGQVVDEVRSIWRESQSNLFWRRFVIDITGLSGYDLKGHQLLHEMYRHGAVFAAATPRSLDFLEQITSGSSDASLLQAAPAARRTVEHSLSPRSRHRAGLGTFEPAARYR